MKETTKINYYNVWINSMYIVVKQIRPWELQMECVLMVPTRKVEDGPLLEQWLYNI